MKKCSQCGKEFDDSVRFCTSCGTPMSDVEPQNAEPAAVTETVIETSSVQQQPAQPVETADQPQGVQIVETAAQPQQATVAPQSQPTQQQAQPAEKKPIDFTLFDKCFWILYIVVGAFAYLNIELGGIYASNASVGFTVFLGVLAILLAIGFVAIAIVRKIATMKESEEDRKKHALRDNICLAVSAVIFVYVLIGAIGLFNIAHTISEAIKYGIV